MEKTNLKEMQIFMETHAGQFAEASEAIGGGYDYDRDGLVNHIKHGNMLLFSKDMKIQANNKRFSQDNVEAYMDDTIAYLDYTIRSNEDRTDSILKDGINTSSSQAVVLSWDCLDKAFELFDENVDESGILNNIKNSKDYLKSALIDKSDKHARSTTVGKVIDGSTINSVIRSAYELVQSGTPCSKKVKDVAKYYKDEPLRVTFIDKGYFHGNTFIMVLQAFHIIALMYFYNSKSWSSKVCKTFERHYERCLANFLFKYLKKNSEDCSTYDFLNALNAGMFLTMPTDRAKKDYKFDNNPIKFLLLSNILGDDAKSIAVERHKSNGDYDEMKDSDFQLTKEAFKLSVIKNLFEAVVNPMHNTKSQTIEKTIDVLYRIYVLALDLKKETCSISGSTSDRDRYTCVDACFHTIKNINDNQRIVDTSRIIVSGIQKKLANLDVYSLDNISYEIDSLKQYILETIQKNHFYDNFMANRSNDAKEAAIAHMLQLYKTGSSDKEIADLFHEAKMRYEQQMNQ